MFLRGMVLGLLIAAPVGPTGVLCIARSLRSGWSVGFFSGLGAATADAWYAAVAAFGLAALTKLLAALSAPLHWTGAAFLLYLGIRTVRHAAVPPAEADRAPSLRGAYASTVALTLVNPATILSFLAIFAAVRGTQTVSGGDAARLVFGVFAGSALWWCILAAVAAHFRARLAPALLARVNVTSGIVLAAFGVFALVSR